MSDCLFCKIIAGEIPSTQVYEDERAYAFDDINPGAPVHVLVVPKKHIERADQIQPEDEATFGHLFTVAKSIAAERGLADYRLVVNNGAGAGQSVFHLHMHVIGGRDLQWPPG